MTTDPGFTVRNVSDRGSEYGDGSVRIRFMATLGGKQIIKSKRRRRSGNILIKLGGI